MSVRDGEDMLKESFPLVAVVLLFILVWTIGTALIIGGMVEIVEALKRIELILQLQSVCGG